ncbi:MAG: class 1 fructose-bisphosphatase, partial [Mesorhizobium sp.]
MSNPTLDAFLASHERQGHDGDVLATVAALTGAALAINNGIRSGTLGSAFGGTTGAVNADGDTQKDLDIYADDIFLEAMRRAPVRCVASEERVAP